MTRTAAFLLACLLAALAPATGPDDAHAAGPWRGQVVDAETGQPIEGVVVVAVWERLSPGVIHQARAFHDVDEVVTDAEGRFVLPERELSPPNPVVTIDGPQLTMFKGGYGLWQFRGAPPMSGPGGASAVLRHSQEAMSKFGRTGATFEMRPFRTREERRRYLSSAHSPPLQVPGRKILRYLDARDEERALFGLERLKEDYLKWEEERKKSLR
jgi:hypothetical protein